MQTLVVIVDGLGGVAVDSVSTPFLYKPTPTAYVNTQVLCQREATITHPNVTSILTGLPASKHKILDNETLPSPAQLRLICENWLLDDDLFVYAPPGSCEPQSGVISMCNLLQHIKPSAKVRPYDLDLTSNAAINQIVRRHVKGHDALVYLPHADHVGHTLGWYGSVYSQTVATIDSWLHRLHTALSYHDTGFDVIVVVSDHGGGYPTHTQHDANPQATTMRAYASAIGLTARGKTITKNITVRRLQTHHLLKLLKHNKKNTHTPMFGFFGPSEEPSAAAAKPQKKKTTKRVTLNLPANSVVARKSRHARVMGSRRVNIPTPVHITKRHIEARGPSGVEVRGDVTSVDIGEKPHSPVLIVKYGCERSRMSEQKLIEQELLTRHDNRQHAGLSADHSRDRGDFGHGGSASINSVTAQAIEMVKEIASHNDLGKAMETHRKKTNTNPPPGDVKLVSCDKRTREHHKNEFYCIPIYLADGSDIVHELGTIHAGRIFCICLCVKKTAAARVTFRECFTQIEYETGITLSDPRHLDHDDGNVTLVPSTIVFNFIQDHCDHYKSGDGCVALLTKYAVHAASTPPEPIKKLLHIVEPGHETREALQEEEE